MKHFQLNVPENFNFGYDVVDEWARIQPEKKAILWADDNGNEKSVTYGQFKDYSDKAASFLQSLGIGKGDCVMLIMKRHVEWWYCMIALHKIGAIAIPASFLLKSKDIVYRCQTANIKAIITCQDDTIMESVDLACCDLREKGKDIVRICAFNNDIHRMGWLDFWAGLGAAAPFRKVEGIRNSDSMLLYFTSGTTGHPKGVVHDFKYPLCHVLTGKYWLNLHEESLHLTLCDTGWMMAAWGQFYSLIFAGACIFVYAQEGKFNAANLLSIIQKYKITSFFAPPTVYRMMLKEGLEKYDLSSLEYCTTAGEALYPKIFDDWKRLTGIRLMECFGQTETPLVVGSYPWVVARPGTMGLPNPMVDVDVVDDEGNSCAPNVKGHLVIYLRNGEKPIGLFKEYYGEPELTAQKFAGRYYDTGDMAYRDEQGYYWYESRADDVIKTSGYRVGPFEVESVLMQHPAVAECAITGVPDDIRGQLIKATIVLSAKYRDKAGDDLAKEIQAFVKSRTAPYKYPRVVEFVAELPKTVNGKIRRVAIREESAR